MTPLMRKIHKWIGLLIGLQLVLWMCSGFVMSLLDAQTVRGLEFRAPPNLKQAWPADAIAVSRILSAAPEAAQNVTTGWLLDQPVYRLTGEKVVQLFNARNGERVELNAAIAHQLAAASYRGPGAAGEAQLVEQTLETRTHAGKVWRVPFADANDTTVYLSQQGDVLEHRNNTWRLFDFVWMLHIMDYTGRQDFNNPLVVSAAVGGFWLALSGMWLLFTSLSLAEFIPRRWRGTRALQVHSPDGSHLRSLRGATGDTVLVALAAQGMRLPSNCGGGQSCGLCDVRVREGAPAATSADRAQLSAAKIAAGHRLACNLTLDRNLDIEVRGGATLWNEHQARVASVHAVTPFLREIVLVPNFKPGVEYQPGVYLQLHIPEYQMERRQLEFPEDHQRDWAALELPERRWHNRSVLRRSYSLSQPVGTSDGRLALLARFSHAKQAGKNHPPGKASAYLYSLKAGDTVHFSGPFGDFAIQPGGREKIFIGGGAGMAPLRAMIRSLLEGGATEPIHFWYGARSLRDAPYVDEMSALAEKFQNFSWHLVLSDAQYSEDAVAGLVSGMVHEAAHQAFLRHHLDLRACDFYVCGPPAMLAATRALLKDLGVAEERVAFDDFKI